MSSRQQTPPRSNQPSNQATTTPTLPQPPTSSQPQTSPELVETSQETVNSPLYRHDNRIITMVATLVPFAPLHRPRNILLVLTTAVFTIQYGNSISDVSALRILQYIICRQIYGDRAADTLVTDRLCDTEEVQSELNIVSVGLTVSSFLPGILVAFGYGLAADKWGRKPVLSMCIAGMVLSSLWWIAICLSWAGGSIRHIWTSSIALLLGGGQSVAEAMVFAIVADISSETSRARNFQIVIAAVLLAETLGPIAASFLTQIQQDWALVFAAPCITTFGGLILSFVPETLSRGGRGPNGSEVDSASRATTYKASLKTAVRILIRRDALKLLPTAALTIPLVTICHMLALRYMSLRYAWTLGQAGLLLGLRTGLSILVLLVGLPLVSHWLNNHYTPRTRDLRMAQISHGLVVVGLGVFAAAGVASVAVVGLVILTLGSGLPSLCRALLADQVDQADTGKLFGGLAGLEIAAFLASALGLGALFQLGIGEAFGRDEHMAALGVPFYCAALVLLAAGLPLYCTSTPAFRVDTESSEMS